MKAVARVFRIVWSMVSSRVREGREARHLKSPAAWGGNGAGVGLGWVQPCLIDSVYSAWQVAHMVGEVAVSSQVVSPATEPHSQQKTGSRMVGALNDAVSSVVGMVSSRFEWFGKAGKPGTE